MRSRPNRTPTRYEMKMIMYKWGLQFSPVWSKPVLHSLLVLLFVQDTVGESFQIGSLTDRPPLKIFGLCPVAILRSSPSLFLCYFAHAPKRFVIPIDPGANQR